MGPYYVLEGQCFLVPKSAPVGAQAGDYPSAGMKRLKGGFSENSFQQICQLLS
jgi:hypothetical protein